MLTILVVAIVLSLCIGTPVVLCRGHSCKTLPILSVIAGEIVYDAITFEHQQMVYNLVHKIPVVADNDDTSLEITEIFFKDIQRHDIEVVCRLVENEEVWVLHEHRAEVETPAFTAGELVDVVLLLQRREQEMLEKLHGRKMPATAKVHIFCDTPYSVDNAHLRFKIKTVLREIAEANRLAYDETPTIRLHKPEQHLHKSALTCTVSSYDAHLLVA